MVDLHPNILEKDGKKMFVALPFDEFVKIQEALLYFRDLKDLREAKEKDVAGLGRTVSSFLPAHGTSPMGASRCDENGVFPALKLPPYFIP